MLDLTSGRPADVLRKRLVQLSCPESSLALTRLDGRDRELIRDFLTAYLTTEPTGAGTHALRAKSNVVDRGLRGNFQFVIDFMNQSPAIDMVAQLCCESLSVDSVAQLNEIELDSNDATMRELRAKIIGAFEKPQASHHDEYELVWNISRFVSGLQEDQLEMLRCSLEYPHWENAQVICDASHTIEDHTKLFTRSQQLAALYRRLKEPAKEPLQYYRDTLEKLYAVPDDEVRELQTRLEINREVNNGDLSELRDEVRDKFMDCSDKAALEAQLRGSRRNITEGQIARAVELVGGSSKEVRKFVRELSRNDLIGLNRVLDLESHGFTLKNED
ncbi:hypothetical protein SLS62_004088 [Diatrype stigma]|uniref:Uncharacterized protein n=1 Tax=Diatrype stigma TaxID=117547 RepID=A0AAN9V3W5_9PEZI